MKPRLLDLCSRAGGASMGFHRAGFEVEGVDIDPQPDYPFVHHVADAVEFLQEHWREYDAFGGGPPCQRWTNCQKIRQNEHPDLIEPLREILAATGKPYIIENVEGAPLRNPVMLCGAMFPGLRVYRHRLFEANFPLAVPEHPEHTARLTKMGRPPVDGEFMHVVGNFSGVAQAREAMGIDWMVRDDLREAIPPAYTEFLGRQMLAQLTEVAA